MSSINFISKNPDNNYSFEDILLHEMGHVYHIRHHKFDKFLVKVLPESRMLRYISHEVYANSFRHALKTDALNHKKILINAKRKIHELIDDYLEILDSDDVPDYIYTIDGFFVVSEDEVEY